VIINEKFVRKMNRIWEGRVYQSWEKEWRRLKHFVKVAPVFQDKKVLEIGCNAGLQALELLQYARSYIGVEKVDEYAKQAAITLSFSVNSNWELLVGKRFDQFFTDIDKMDFDTYYGSFILYHMNEQELVFLKEKILPRCYLAVIFTRTHDRKNEKNPYRLNRMENVVRLLEDAGFKTETQWGDRKIFHGVIGNR
jgi:SAM-dependent methyltransferase